MFASRDGVIKSIASLFALSAVAVLVPFYGCGRWFFGAERVFPGWSQLFALFPGLLGNYLRRAFYWWALPQAGDGCCICFGVIFSHPTASIGRNVYIGPYGVIGDVTLEDDVLLGSQVSIANGKRQHGIERLDVPVREQPGQWPRVTIGQDTWIGDRAIIMADVGKHCVIGAGSVVAKPIPDYAIAIGCPARVVRFRGEMSKRSTTNDDLVNDETPNAE